MPNVETTIDKPETQINKITSSTIRHKNKSDKKKINLTLAFAVVALILSVITVLVVQSTMPSANTQKNTGANNNSDAVVDEPQGNLIDELGDKKDTSSTEESKNLPRVPFANLDDEKNTPSATDKPTNQFVGKKELDRCWRSIKPYLVELYAETPTGSTTATGIIIDSRGWVATSYNAFKGATEISLRLAVEKTQISNDRTDDKVRGVIAVKPEHDLLLLAINRSLINTIEDASFSDEKRFVVSQYAVQCQPPSSLYPYSCEETKIVHAAKTQDLNPDIAKRMEFRSMDPDVRWVGHKNQSPLKIGAPLLDSLGNVVAMNTAAYSKTDELTIAVPAKHISDLKESARDKILPLPVGQVASVDDEPQTIPEKTQSVAPVVKLDANSRELSEALNRIGEQCQVFQWWPTSESENTSFRQFLTVLVQAKEMVDQFDDADEESETLRQQMEQWQEEMSSNLGPKRSPSTQAQSDFNRKFAANPSNEQPFAAYVFVSHPALLFNPQALGKSDRALDIVGFEIRGLPDAPKILANVQPDWPGMPIDSPWLIIGTRSSGFMEAVSQSQDGTTQRNEPLRIGNIDFAFPSNAP